MENILHLEELVISLIFIAMVVGIAARKFRVPYTVGLVIVGVGLAFSESVEVTVTPELILGLLVPPLVFEAALHLRLKDLNRDLLPILAFAIPGVILTTVLVGAVLAWGTGIDVTVAIAFGALIAATDPVSVVALFRSLGVPKRLQVLLEGESLLNDGTAIVIYTLAISIIATGNFNLFRSLGDFVLVAGGGVLVGLILGWLGSLVLSRIDDHLIETGTTFILAYGAYLIAENLHVSGVLAVVVAGLINGNLGPRNMSPTTRIVVVNFWEFAAFLANSLIFLLIGLETNVQSLLQNWQMILWAIGAVLIARALVIYSLSRTSKEIPFSWQHILFWGGLRGAISLALALGLPASLGVERARLQAMAFGVALFSIMVQGTTMSTLVRWVKLIQRSETREEFERRHARAASIQAARQRVSELHHEGMISEQTWDKVSTILENYGKTLTKSVREWLSSDENLVKEELDATWREALRSQRTFLTTLFNDNVITEEVYTELVTEVDAILQKHEIDWVEVGQLEMELWSETQTESAD